MINTMGFSSNEEKVRLKRFKDVFDED